MIVNLFGANQFGKSRKATAVERLNLYAEITQDKSQITHYGTPGLSLFYSFGDTPIRGSIAVGDFKYDVHRGTLWQVNNAGAKTSLGTIGTTSGRVAMAYNGTQIAIVDGVLAGFYVLTIATGVLDTVTANVIGTPIDITFQDGYGILGFADGKFQLTAAYDFKTLDAIDFATAESNPDGLSRIVADHGEIVIPGGETGEFWGNTGAQDFPYSNQRGSTLEFGLAAPWSLVKYNDSLAGLFKNKMGQVQVMMMRGHALTPISNQELDYVINNYSAVSDATAYAYMLGGHPMYQINFPTAGKSHLYDASTGLWTQLESGLSGNRHRGEILVDYLNKPRVSDYENGNVYTIEADTYSDNGTAIPRQLITKHLDRVSISRLQVEFEPGVGLATGQGSDPQVMLQISRDGGFTWGNELWRSIGKVGKYTARAIWNRLGSARDWVFKIRITDPVKVVITNAVIDADIRQ